MVIRRTEWIAEDANGLGSGAEVVSLDGDDYSSPPVGATRALTSDLRLSWSGPGYFGGLFW